MLSEPTEQRVYNDTGQVIEILRVLPGGSTDREQLLEPGFFYPLNLGHAADGSCPAPSLVARSLDGRELARRDGPFCPQDEWFVTDPDAAPTS